MSTDKTVSFEKARLKSLRAHLRRLFGVSKPRSSPNPSLKFINGTVSKSYTSEKFSPTLTTPSNPVPEFQQALVVARKREYELRDDFPIPELRDDDEVMIKNYAVALNPIDWKSVDYNFCLPSFPWVTGRESSGVVAKVGKNVTHLKPGDRVWTSTYYRDVRAGCFQEYIVVPQHTVLPIPSDLSFEEAACLGVAALTASMTLWKWLDVPMPRAKSRDSASTKFTTSGLDTPQSIDSGYMSAESLSSHTGDEQWILIWGGSTVTGQFATQLSALSGLKPITICSSRTAELSKALGAEHVVIRDNRTPEEIRQEIEDVTKGSITRAIDLVGGTTAAQCLQVCSTYVQRETYKEADRIPFAPLAMMAKDQEIPDLVRVETVEMKRFVLDADSKVYAQRLNELIESACIKLPELEVLNGGLAKVELGLNMLKKGDMGGKKLVVSLRSQ